MDKGNSHSNEYQINRGDIGYIGYFGIWKNRVLDFNGEMGDMQVI